MEIEVVYEKGVFKPLRKVSLPEGTKGKVKLFIDVKKHVMEKLDEEKIKELEEKFENENIY